MAERTKLVLELQHLIQEGRQKGLWRGQLHCARVLGIPDSTLATHVSGRIADTFVQLTVDRIREALEQGTTPHREQAAVLLESLKTSYQAGVEVGFWFSLNGCASVIRVDRKSLKRFLEIQNATEIVTMRDIRYLRDLQKRMALRLSKLKAHPPPSQKKTAATKRPSESRAAEAARKGEQAGVIRSKLFDELLAGRIEVAGQSIPNVRFVLTVGHFVELFGNFTKEEISDTKKLVRHITAALEELRRRLNVSLQLVDTKERATITEALDRELRELCFAIEMMREVIPSRAAERLARVREQMEGFFSSQKPKK